MKRALYIGGFIMPDGNAAAQRVLSISKILKELGYDTRFAGLQHDSASSVEGNIEDMVYVGYPYPKSPYKWWRYLTGHDYSIPEIKRFKPDLVILYNHPAIAIERIADYCHKHSIKVIADVTEWYASEGNPIFKLIKGYDTKRRMTKSHKQLDGLICISRYLADYYKDMPVAMIPPTVDCSQEKWHHTTSENLDTINIVYAGSPGKIKIALT